MNRVLHYRRTTRNWLKIHVQPMRDNVERQYRRSYARSVGTPSGRERDGYSLISPFSLRNRQNYLITVEDKAKNGYSQGVGLKENLSVISVYVRGWKRTTNKKPNNNISVRTSLTPRAMEQDVFSFPHSTQYNKWCFLISRELCRSIVTCTKAFDLCQLHRTGGGREELHLRRHNNVLYTHASAWRRSLGVVKRVKRLERGSWKSRFLSKIRSTEMIKGLKCSIKITVVVSHTNLDSGRG